MGRRHSGRREEQGLWQNRAVEPCSVDTNTELQYKLNLRFMKILPITWMQLPLFIIHPGPFQRIISLVAKFIPHDTYPSEINRVMPVISLALCFSLVMPEKLKMLSFSFPSCYLYDLHCTLTLSNTISVWDFSSK